MKRILFAATAMLALLDVSKAFSADVIVFAAALPNIAADMPVHVATKLGYFKELNLDVQVTDYRGGQAAQEAMTGGAADILSYFLPGVALAVQKGAKEKIICSVQDIGYGFYMLGSTKAGIKSVADLAGKKIGVSGKGATSDYLALWSLDHAGINAQVVPLGGGTVVGMKSGQVEAIMLSGMLAVDLIASQEAVPLIDFGKEKGMEGAFPASVLIASDDIIKKRPEQVKNFLTAFYKALAYMKANRDWSIKFIEEKAQIDKRAAEITYDLITPLRSDCRIADATIKNVLDFAAKAWSQPELRSINPSQIITDQFLPK